MTTGRTVILPRAGSDSRRPSMTMLAGEATREGYQRLALLAAILGGALLALHVVVLIEWLVTRTSEAPAVPSRYQFTLMAITIALCAFVAVAAWRGLFPPRMFVQVALAYEVITSAIFAAHVRGWQFRLGPDAFDVIDKGLDWSWQLGSGEMTTVGVWVIFFAMLVPLRPRQHLVGALISAAILLAWPAISVALLGMREELVAVQGMLVFRITMRMAVPTLLAVGMAYFASRAVYGLRRELSRARRMGSYQLQKKLGEGGMGEVWIADHQMLARSSAIKLIKSNGAPGTDPGWESMVRRFEREVQATAHLRSPHTIEIYDYGLADDGSFYYVMELLDGLDLQQLVKRYGPPPWARAAFFMRQMCHSLGEAHAHDLIHRDIKPANIFTCRLGRDADQIKVLDFGLVTRTSPLSGDAKLTQEGSFVGTPAYAAPELATGSVESADARSDIYSLGCVAYWLLTGGHVFRAETAVEMLIKHARDVPLPPSGVTALEIPEELDALVMACLAKDPDARPASTDELDARLAELETIAVWTKSDALEWWDLHRPVEETEVA